MITLNSRFLALVGRVEAAERNHSGGTEFGRGGRAPTRAVGQTDPAAF